jgi:hypothetical protein
MNYFLIFSNHEKQVEKYFLVFGYVKENELENY